MWMLGSWLVGIMVFLFCAVSLFMILVVLIQKPRGGGLSGAFGGAGGSSQAVFGSKTGDVLTLFTVICFGAFLALAMGLTWAIKPERPAGIEEFTPPPVQEREGGEAAPSSSSPEEIEVPMTSSPVTEPTVIEPSEPGPKAAEGVQGQDGVHQEGEEPGGTEPTP